MKYYSFDKRESDFLNNLKQGKTVEEKDREGMDEVTIENLLQHHGPEGLYRIAGQLKLAAEKDMRDALKQDEKSDDESYSEFVSSIVKSGNVIAREMTTENAHLMHMAIGISGEAGELLDAIKKVIIYGQDLDLVNVKEELGDLEFYIDGFRQGCGLTRKEIIDGNIGKLSKRYHSGSYSNDHAKERKDKK